LLTTRLAPPITPGSLIAGKYRIEEELGRGTMGTVYRAVHGSLGQRVAIKLIASEHSQSAEARARFRVEAKAAARLRSRHVVQVIDDGETPEGNPYIVMEYLEGETLEQRLAREHALPLAEAVRVVTHVGRALARAHAEGIVHRDLKPANIFLVTSEDDEAGWLAKVLDFGIAKLQHEAQGTTQAGTLLGTPLFMSPEQVRGASTVDHRADLYSLGMCFFHMLTGDYAHDSPTYGDILVAICTQPLPKLRARAPWLPEPVELWFQRACAKEPLERFQSADEMLEALRVTGSYSPLSRQSSPSDARIAPETLVGFAAPPALVASPGDAAQLGFARTQPLNHGSGPAPGALTVPIAVAVSAGPSVRTGRSSSARSRAQLTRRHLAPWLLGAGLGLFALAVLGLALRWAKPAELDSSPPRAQGAVVAPLPPVSSAVTTSSAAGSREARPEPGTSSSVAAAKEPLPPAPSVDASESPRKRGKTPSASTSPAPPSPTVLGTDLGF
jgi:eukaryotic-like serine/threonine-protein kinase